MTMKIKRSDWKTYNPNRPKTWPKDGSLCLVILHGAMSMNTASITLCYSKIQQIGQDKCELIWSLVMNKNFIKPATERDLFVELDI
jgi:hypothetical protein